MTKVFYEIDEYGTIRWYKKNTDILHREEGPAVEWNDGTKCWYQNGELHRKDGPAIECIDGYKEYYLNDIFYLDIKTDEEWVIFQIIN